ncbi:protein MEI2-like 6 [Camellia sinensis]|uniref:Mei2-like C-terminal RNA recognition motif domain-containing protein n=1 Tax=Camellia sinensis var. sinensis TaxID=542762 RepID=A0A4S4ERZ1_CAMSN|nr:protein MEI2-like 6 [Camellia sinensis]THG18956.1 hypothetical protein TEA_029305 [Camellia sinensis var. sinensis]
MAQGLNPEAPHYIPLSHRSPPPITYSDLPPPPPLHNLSILPLFSPSTTPTFFYHSPPPPPPPPPPPHFSTAQPLYTTTITYPIQPHHPHLLPPPPPPHTAEQSREVRREEAANERVGRCETEWRPKKGGHSQREGATTRARNPTKFGNNRNDKNQVVHKKVGSSSRVFLNKHDVLPLEDDKTTTTVMIKNIPKEYNREMILKFLDEHCNLENQRRTSGEAADDVVSAYDFMYLPMDFRSGFSRGYAFVNFTEARAVWKFHKACNRKTWDFVNSPKICQIVCAIIQGREALVRHFERSTFWCGSDEMLPVCFAPPRDGSGESVHETKIGRRISTTIPTFSGV